MTGTPPDPYFHLPDPIVPDNPAPQQCLAASVTTLTQTPPITVSCGSCERIVGDSSSFICAVRRIGGIVLDQMVGISLGDIRVTGMAGDEDPEEFDQQCLFRPVQCSKCAWVLGKMYTSIAAGVPLEILNKYTVSRCRVLFYTHGQPGRAVPLAESEEIMRQLHPEPDEVARNLQQVMGLLVYLKEEQDGIVRELKRVGEHCGVEVAELGGGAGTPIDGQEELGTGWKDRMGKLESDVERLKAIVGEVLGVGVPVGKMGTRNRMGVQPQGDNGGESGDAIDDGLPPPAKRQRPTRPMWSNKHPRKSPSLVRSPTPLPSTPPPAPAHSTGRLLFVEAQTGDKARDSEIDDSESDRGEHGKSRKIRRTYYKKDGNNTEGGEKDSGDIYSICTPPRKGRQNVERGQERGSRLKSGDRERGGGQAAAAPKALPGRGSQPGPGRRRKGHSGGGND